jgi:hypothetical protein
MFHWTQLPAWAIIPHSTKHIFDVDKNIIKILDKDGLFDEFIHIANISKTRKEEWNTCIKHLKFFKVGLKYLSLCKVKCILLESTIHFGILFCHSWY